MAKPKQPRITGTDSVRYLRVSSPGQVETEYNPEGISLPAQREACVTRERELGSVNAEEFIEPGHSAKTIENRPAFQEMLAYLSKHPNVGYVIVYALSRFARNRYDDAVTMMALKQMGVQLVSATEKNLDDSPAGRLMHGMLAVINEYQVDQNGADIKYKMGQKVTKHGGTISRAKLGYLNETVRFDGHKVNTIAVDPERARYIPMAFELYATGQHTYETVRDALTDAGLRTRGNRRWGPRPISTAKVGELLQDRYYLGYVTYEDVEYKGRHEPLVTQELFDRVQRVLQNERQSGTRQRTHDHYLKGVLWCQRCKRRLILMPGKSRNGQVYFYFICRGRQDHVCDLEYLHVSKVERAVENHHATVHALGGVLRGTARPAGSHPTGGNDHGQAADRPTRQATRQAGYPGRPLPRSRRRPGLAQGEAIRQDAGHPRGAGTHPGTAGPVRQPHRRRLRRPGHGASAAQQPARPVPASQPADPEGHQQGHLPQALHRCRPRRPLHRG